LRGLKHHREAKKKNAKKLKIFPFSVRGHAKRNGMGEDKGGNAKMEEIKSPC